MTKNKGLITILGIITVLAILFIIDGISESQKTYIKYTDFKQKLYSGDIEKASIDSDRVVFYVRKDSGEYYTDNPETTDLKENLLVNNVEIVDTFGSDDFAVLFDGLFYLFFFAMVGIAIYKFTQVFGGNNFKVVRSSKTRFDNICGLEELKKDMTKTVDLLKDPEKYLKMGIRPPKGIILEGPPGNGKTLFARALAGEAGINLYQLKVQISRVQ